MNIELAKELKEAGLPQDKSEVYWKIDVGEPYQVYKNSRYYDSKGQIMCACPTLEELIEACGDRFKHLVHEKDTKSFREWYASDGSQVWKEDCSWGLTPVEAVANLYLALNKK